MLALLGLLIASTAVGVDADADPFDGFHWRDDFSTATQWTPEPSWLGNVSETARVESEKDLGVFRVDEPGRGMKWSSESPSIDLVDFPYLVVRYRAEHIDTSRTDYFVHLDDGRAQGQLDALRLSDVKSDGRWRVVAVDLTALTEAASVSRPAIQVQADHRGNALVEFDWIMLSGAVPDDAELLERTPLTPRLPEWPAPLEPDGWTARLDWLDNSVPEEMSRVRRENGVTVFQVDQAGGGMKWSCDLPQEVSLLGHHYVSMRYRAVGARPISDYTVCVLGKTLEGPADYRAIVPAEELQCDGRWHRLDVDVRRIAAVIPKFTMLCIQLQAAEPNATLEVSDLRLVNVRRLGKLADAIDWIPRAPHGASEQLFHPISLGPAVDVSLGPWLARLRIEDWFSARFVDIHGVPLTLAAEADSLASSSLQGKSELRFPTDINATEVYLLLLAAFSGAEEPAYGSGRFNEIADVDRFRLRLEYADGTVDECLPMNVATGRFAISEGIQLVVAAADPKKRLTTVVLCDTAKQAAFAVAGLTARTQERGFPAALEETPAMQVRSAELQDWAVAWTPPDDQRQMVVLEVDGRPITSEQLQPIASDDRDFRWYQIDSTEGLRLGVSIRDESGAWRHNAATQPILTVAARLENDGLLAHVVTLVAPSIGPYALSEQPENAYYFLPRRGAVLDNRPGAFRERYCGLFPVQFLDTFSPIDGRGLSLRTTDLDCLRKRYLLEKDDQGQFTLGVEYPEITLGPGESFQTAPAVISATNGDWLAGFRDYRQWVESWHEPLSPRKDWFRRVFNFRQRFLWTWDPLYDPDSGVLKLGEAVDEARREFGGVDYLHLFDWGNCPGTGRIYGRTGDHSPFEHIQGGREALRAAIADVQADGVPVGLYIEGYLLQERGKLGQEFGRQWQLVDRNDQGLYWPDSSEMFVCPAVEDWREVQASTYETKVRELNVDGMYIDQFGFAGEGKDCWSRDHGHPTPSYAVETERDATRLIRDRIDAAKRNVALYTEECPVDVTSQYQDGSFSYAMFAAQRSQTLVPLNVFRFAVPDFKSIEILFCDKPTGSWATGVKWIFFNGEAIWLEGKADEWFEPETRAAIRRCYRILHEHADAFTTLQPVPLVPTEAGGLYANEFPVEGKTVYTLYNTRHRTLRGPALRMPHSDGAAYHDAWNDRAAVVHRDGADDVIHLEVGPLDVGCVVVSRK